MLNPIASHLDVMRTTLLGGLLEALRTNLNRKRDARAHLRGRPLLRARRRAATPSRCASAAWRIGAALPEQWGERQRAPSISSTSRATSRRWPRRGG